MVIPAVRLHIPYLTGRCQRLNAIGAHGLAGRIRGRIACGLGIKSGLRRLIRQPYTPWRTGRLGAPSRYREGDWVRVRDETNVRRTLDGRSRLRGLEFTPQLWSTCGRVFRVAAFVRRIIDDSATLRPVSGTVLLAGVDCGGEDGTQGCGRRCPMLYRDEWLEPADSSPDLKATVPETSETPTREVALFARIRPWGEISRTLDSFGLRDGLMFMPEMSHHLGQRLPVVHQVHRVFEYDRWLETPAPFYVLEGLRCSGAVLGSDGPCHRACWLLWHADWLSLETQSQPSRAVPRRERPGPDMPLPDTAARATVTVDSSSDVRSRYRMGD